MSSAESKGRGAHTPGPWDYYEVDTSINVRARGGVVCKIVIKPNSARANEGRANARLIAAAPDLLAALEELLKIRSGRTVSAARAAIRRATGESSK